MSAAILGSTCAPSAAADLGPVYGKRHANALWAAEEIKKRTGGRYEIGVFPASQLGNENQINEGLGLGTVDIIYTGASFAGSIHKPLAITGAPFILRDFDHWKAYRDSQLFRDLAKGYEDKTRHKVVAILYYGQRMDWTPGEAVRRKILVETPARLFGN